MKILVSWLKDYVDIPVPVEQLAADLTMRGFEVASIEPVDGRADDAVIDFEITANRPDCLSVIGMAREAAVKYGQRLRAPASASGFGAPGPEPAVDAGGRDGSPSRPTTTAPPTSAVGDLRVTVERPDLCPLYCAALVDVTVGPSPAWLVDRLTLSGVRSINNIVDVTNYVLLELNQPLHAFDYETITDRHLCIRTARPGERLTTLDGVARTLADDMLVIADAARAQAIAGVMGGAETEIGPGTRTIALESAYFEPAQVRRTRRRLNLSTEASYRFERGTDPSMPARALARAVELIAQIGAGTVRAGGAAIGDATPPLRTVPLRWARIGRVLGMEVPVDEVHAILTSLGFGLARAEDAGVAGSPARGHVGTVARGPVGTTGPTVRDNASGRAVRDNASGGAVEDNALGRAGSPSPAVDAARADVAWEVRVPGWRGDVTREEDLIEEVARCAGYDRLPATFPPLAAPPPRPAPRLRRDARVRDMLVGAGFAEAVTFTFIEKQAAAPFDTSAIAIANPLSELFSVLRPSLLPGVVDSVSHNRRREQRDIRLFEIGTRFTTVHGETRSVAVAWTGAASPEHWSGSGRLVDEYDVLGIVDRIAAVLRVSIEVEAAGHTALAPGRAGRLVRVDDSGARVEVGWVGRLAPALADARGIPATDPVMVAEIDLDLAAPHYDPDRQVVMKPLPRHPSVVRDISIVVPADLPAARVRGTIHASAPSTLVAVREFDRYQGKSLPDGTVSLSLRLTYRAPDRTLTDAEVHAATDAILAALTAEHGATLRT